MLLISIRKPCHENWDEMSPRQQGAFCAVCSKTVVDFTSLSEEEVKNYFLKNSGQKTCGRFRNDQLTEPRTLSELLSGSIPFWKKFLAIVLILFGNLLTGCQDKTKSKVEIPLQMTVRESESPSAIDDILTGIKPDTTELVCTTTKGETSMGVTELPPTLGEITEVVIGELNEKTDTIFIPDKLKEEVIIKPTGPVIPKTDSIKKAIKQNDCDTLLKKPIEP
jgi:hypothetical protein